MNYKISQEANRDIENIWILERTTVKQEKDIFVHK